MAEVKDISGREGNFKVSITQNPRYVDMDKCIACGACAEKCPKKVNDSYNQDLIKRKAIYLQYAQAVPLKYVIDERNCIYFKKGKCRACEKFCPADAINFEDASKDINLSVGSIILSPGFEPFDPSELDTYGYTKNPNVITSMEMERILSASGPTNGHLIRMSDHKEPKKIAWFQCIGSRDMNRCDNAYCSSVCCMYAIKEALIAKEHADYDLECTIFFMDMRTHGKDFEYFYNNAKEKGIRFIRSRVHTVDPIMGSEDVSVRYISERGETITEVFDKIVLSVGLQTRTDTVNFAKKFNIALTEGNFCKTSSLEPVSTSQKGIYACGSFQGPRDIPQSVIDASAAACAAGQTLSYARNTKTLSPEIIPELSVVGERIRIGVFICMCGINIAGTVDVPAVRDYAAGIPYVEYSVDNLYSCSKDSQDAMVDAIKKHNLNRIVVAACTPKTHEPLFQETLRGAGLNKYLFEMCNIRNQNSWVHKSNPEMATKKAKDLVLMAVSKVALMQPLEESKLTINQVALVLGGGIAGITAAKSLASQGYETHIIEKKGKLGGNALDVYKSSDGTVLQNRVLNIIEKLETEDKINIHLHTELTEVDGFVGNFKSTLSSNGKKKVIEHGVAIIATGGSVLKPSDYMYGTDTRILTSLELDKKLINGDRALKNTGSVVFIQCVGSRDPDNKSYCSRVCCSHSMDNALELKKINPSMNIYILYRDIRTYGEREYLYTKARKAGVVFIRYELEKKPTLTIVEDNLIVCVNDHVLGNKLEISTNMVVLSSAIVPNKNEALSKLFKVPLNGDGFFVERHAKLGPSEFATDGVFLCGLSHYPKPIDESIAQGMASASRAVTLLSKNNIYTSGTIASVDQNMCSSCGICVSICSYSAPLIPGDNKFNSGKAEINPVLCKGCGLCVASCRSGAIHLRGFDNDQIFAQISALNN